MSDDQLDINVNVDYDVQDDVEAYLQIHTWPLHSEKLTTSSVNVIEINKKLKKFIQLMKTTIKKHNAVGLAAPQVGANLRIAVVDMGEPTVLINPDIIFQEGEQIVNEGCLSVPGVYKDRKFSEKVIVQAIDESGEKRVLEFNGIVAAVLEHEMDHLDGKLMVQYLSEVEKSEAEKTVKEIISKNPDLYAD